VKQLEIRRHAHRDRTADRLSARGRAQAEDAGRASDAVYSMVFVSPAARAAETAAWFLRGTAQQLPEHAVIPGLAGQGAGAGTPEGMAAGIRALLAQVPEGGRGLAISHTPLVEAAALGLSGIEVAPLGECEGILVSQADDGTLTIRELRGGGAAQA
jgi:phosphohistidine phosphatase SixA